MPRARKFDWDEAKRLYDEGWSKAALGRRYGVSHPSISRVVDLRMRKAQKDRLKALMAATCEDCGAECSKNWYSERCIMDRVVCAKCSFRRAREDHLLTRLNEDGEIRCRDCQQYRPVEEFRIVRGFPFKVCRDCETAARREWRERNRERERAWDRERRRKQRQAVT